MNVGPDPQAPVDASQIEQARRQIKRLAEEIAQLSEMELSPPEYYGEFLQRLMTAIQAPAGAVWIKTPQGNLQIQYQINMRLAALDKEETMRAQHGELLREVTTKGQPRIILPRSSIGETADGKTAAGNPTDFVILIAPIMYDKQVAGLVEIWQDPNRGPDAQRGFLNFVVQMAALAAGYTRNHQLRQMVSQEQVWLQLEAFAQKIHASLNPVEVAYLVANEGRRLVEADRVSVAVREGKKAHVKAVSGADVVEKRSNLVQLMRTLFDKVIQWGDKLVYSGIKDEGLPPGVLHALDAYLAESNSKFLVVLPLKDERDTDTKKKARSAIMMENFETAAGAGELAVGKLEVVGRHAASALYNSAEYRRIPMRFLWLPLAKVQDGLGGKAKAIITLVAASLVLFIAAMVIIPYPLRMEANGSLLPIKRQWVYATNEGRIVHIPAGLKSGERIFDGQELLHLSDQNLAKEEMQLMSEILAAEANMKAAGNSGREDNNGQANKDLIEANISRNLKAQQLANLKARVNATNNLGEFTVKSPMTGIMLSSDFRENLLNRFVKPNEPLLRVGYTDQRNPKVSDWEIELKIPQKHIGHVLEAFRDKPMDAELDVDILLVSMPNRSYKGKLLHSKVAKLANPQRDANNEPEPVVLAWVRISPKDVPNGKDAKGNPVFVPDIPEDYQLTPDRLLAGTEVHCRVRCGNRAMGYSLFYGVWEFFYEKVVFFF